MDEKSGKQLTCTMFLKDVDTQEYCRRAARRPATLTTLSGAASGFLCRSSVCADMVSYPCEGTAVGDLGSTSQEVKRKLQDNSFHCEALFLHSGALTFSRQDFAAGIAHRMVMTIHCL